ncbi:putative disease resistance protein [Vitis vinifera]|uniref:Putative disease resistance protein n=1 Tax=Vitis vinifera TaxID=29760 RepID=A0A438CQY9_VITVI|nr:putative disease resistance protein [Vitis vinifera]
MMPLQMHRLTSLQTLSHFVVGKNGGSGIGDLRNMSHLQGKLLMTGLQNVASFWDAAEAKLKDKHEIDELAYEQEHDETPSEQSGNLDDSRHGRVDTDLPSLKYLTIKGMEGIKMVGTEFYKDGCSSLVPFPSLETLKFENMLEWEHRNKADYFPCLLELSIRACPNLRELPNLFPSLAILDIDGCLELAALPRLPLIRELELMKCGEGVLQSVAKFTSLTYLHLSHISEIEFLPEGFFHHLTALEELQISHFCRLTTLSNEIGLQNLPYLKRLKISACPCLEELPQNLHSLVSLIELKVWKCPRLVSFPESGFPSMLRILEIKDCEPLESLPEWIMHNNDGNKKNTMSHLLEYFVIEGCSTLKCLPRGKLPSTLKKLEIQNCMNLDSLPEDMTSVQFLKISACSIVSFPKGGLHTVPSSNFMKLKQLIINKCMKLESLPEGLHNLMYLDHLEIAECPLLFSFPGPGLPTTKLRTLKISNCINFKSLPNRIYNLTSLQELCIDGCCSLASLPEGGLPNSLILLSILDCKNLKPSYDWGLHRLTSLNHFSFGGCPDLMSLPEEWLLPTTISSVHLQWLPRLKSLPRGLQKLKSLEKLEIWECGNLLTLPEEGQSKMQWNLQFWDVL